MQTPLLFPRPHHVSRTTMQKKNNYCPNDTIGCDLQGRRGRFIWPRLFLRSALGPIQYTSAAPVTARQCRAASVLQHLQPVASIKVCFFNSGTGTSSSQRVQRQHSVKAENCCRQLLLLFLNIWLRYHDGQHSRSLVQCLAAICETANR